MDYDLFSDSIPSHPVGESDSLYANSVEKANNTYITKNNSLSIAGFLDLLCQKYNRIWWRNGNAIFFRNIDWFLQKGVQIPPHVLKLFSELPASKFTLKQEHLEALSFLSPQQISTMLTLANEYDKVFFEGHAYLMPSGMPTMYHILHFYRTLSNQQKETCLRSTGVRYAELSPIEKNAYKQMLIKVQADFDTITAPPNFCFSAKIANPSAKATPLLDIRFFDLSSMPAKPRVLDRIFVPLPPDK